MNKSDRYHVGDKLPGGETVAEVTFTGYLTDQGFVPAYGPVGVHKPQAATPLVAIG